MDRSVKRHWIVGLALAALVVGCGKKDGEQKDVISSGAGGVKGKIVSVPGVNTQTSINAYRLEGGERVQQPPEVYFAKEDGTFFLNLGAGEWELEIALPGGETKVKKIKVEQGKPLNVDL